MTTKFAIGQFVWAMSQNKPVKAKVEKIVINRFDNIEYLLSYQWNRGGSPEKFTRYEHDIAEEKEGLMDLLFSRS